LYQVKRETATDIRLEWAELCELFVQVCPPPPSNLPPPHPAGLASELVEEVADIYFYCNTLYTVKKLLIFPSPAGMSLTKLSLVGNNLINPDKGEFGS
jgi:hypothetical protein